MHEARDDKEPRVLLCTRRGDIKFNYASRGKPAVREGVEIPATKIYYVQE